MPLESTGQKDSFRTADHAWATVAPVASCGLRLFSTRLGALAASKAARVRIARLTSKCLTSASFPPDRVRNYATFRISLRQINKRRHPKKRLKPCNTSVLGVFRPEQLRENRQAIASQRGAKRHLSRHGSQHKESKFADVSWRLFRERQQRQASSWRRANCCGKTWPRLRRASLAVGRSREKPPCRSLLPRVSVTLSGCL